MNPRNINEKPFWTDKDNSVMVQMMKENAALYNYANTGNLEALDLNYLGGNISMVVLLPRDLDGIESLEKSMNTEKLYSIKNSMSRQPLTVQIPKFEFETECNLIEPLQSLGLHNTFDRDNANFQGITDEQIYLEQVKHKAFVNVNEEGTEAATITALVARATSGPPESITEFVADHPFMLIMQEKESGQILFIGKGNGSVRITDV